MRYEGSAQNLEVPFIFPDEGDFDTFRVDFNVESEQYKSNPRFVCVRLTF